MDIIGRVKELNFLEEKYASLDSELIVVYGRRRLGKTLLLKESIKKLNYGMYFLLTNESPNKNLEDFREILSEKLNQPLIKEVTSTSWSDFFRKILPLLPNNYVFIFDEIPYLFSQEKSLISQFQKIYDEYFQEKKIKLILCGSSISVMDEIQSYSSPLYGRRTGKINLKPFTIEETQMYLSQINSLEDVFKYHLLFGGVPYYLKQIDQTLSFKQNIKSLFFGENTIFDDEISFLLKEEFKEIRNYQTILKAISVGKNTYSKINEVVELKSSLSSYLTSLESLSLISQKRSFFDKENSKKTKYILTDNFIFIWFNVFYKYKKQISNDLIQEKIIQEIIPQGLGFLFEKECLKILSSKYLKINSFFNKEGVEIDLLCLNEDDSIDVFECKFQKHVRRNEVLTKLKTKIQSLPEGITVNNMEVISIDEGLDLKKLLELSKTNL
jgi:AAA+ ATPase superfamily predicted ATPase